jgi:hypothetical protein
MAGYHVSSNGFISTTVVRVTEPELNEALYIVYFV